MASLGQAKTLGGVGSILACLFFIPNAGAFLFIIGLILILFAVKNAADSLGDQSIFNNMLYSVILAIVGVVAITAIYFVALASFAGLGFLGGVPSRTGVTTGFFAIIGTLILGLVVLWVFILTSAIFLKKTYDAMAVKMRVDMFRTTGLLFLIGAATLVVGIGFIIVFITAILQIVNFFSIPEQLQPSMPSQQAWGPPAPPPPMAPSQAPTQ